MSYELWAQSNNLSLNISKTREVIFSDTRKKQTVLPPAPLPGITRWCLLNNTSLKILGVTITGNLSASEHIRGVVSDCSQTLYALRVLRNHGCDAGLLTGCLPVCCRCQDTLCVHSVQRLYDGGNRATASNELMHFFAEANDMDSVHQTCRHLSCCWKTQINSCSIG